MPNLDDRIFRMAYTLARMCRPSLYEAGEREFHLHLFSAATLCHLVASVGFQVIETGFDRGAAATWDKSVVNELAYVWLLLTEIHWGMALQVHARKLLEKMGPYVSHTGTPSRESSWLGAVSR